MPKGTGQGQEEKTLEEMREMLMDEASEIYQGLADDESDPAVAENESIEEESSTREESDDSEDEELDEESSESSEDDDERIGDEEAEEDASQDGPDEEVEEEPSAISLSEIDDPSEIIFETDDGEKVSLETLLRERMPRDKFLQKSEEIANIRKEAEALQEEARRTIEGYENMERLALDPKAFVEQFLTMRVNEGILPKQVLDDTMDAFSQAEDGGLYDPNAIKARIAQIDSAREAEARRAKEDEERAAKKARADVADIESELGRELTQKERQAIFDKIREVAESDGYVPSVKMVVRAYRSDIIGKESSNGKRVSSPSKRKIIESIRKKSTTEERPTSGTSNVQRSLEQEAREVWESLVNM